MTFVLVLGTTAASAQYKCVDAAGKTSFQQAPCPPDQRSSKLDIRQTPLTAPPNSAVAPSDLAKQPRTVEQRMVAKLEKERRIKELEDRIAGLDNQIMRRNAQMDIDIQRLRATKSYAKNNLAGATWEQSLSTEMQAIVAKASAQNEADLAQLKQLRLDLERVKQTTD